MRQVLQSCSESYGVKRLDHKPTAERRQLGRIVCSLYKRQDCRASDLKYQIKMHIMVKESVGMLSVIFTVLQIVLTVKLSTLFSAVLGHIERAKYLCSKTNQMHNISNLFYFGTTPYMFRTVSPSIIRSLRLYIPHQVYVIQVRWLLVSKQPQNLYGMMLYVQS